MNTEKAEERDRLFDLFFNPDRIDPITKEGNIAFHRGIPIKMCPYTDETKKLLWEDGWITGEECESVVSRNGE